MINLDFFYKMTVGTFSHNTIWGEVISENHSYFHAEPVFLNIYSIYFIFSFTKYLNYFVKIQVHENKNNSFRMEFNPLSTAWVESEIQAYL